MSQFGTSNRNLHFWCKGQIYIKLKPASKPWKFHFFHSSKVSRVETASYLTKSQDLQIKNKAKSIWRWFSFFSWLFCNSQILMVLIYNTMANISPPWVLTFPLLSVFMYFCDKINWNVATHYLAFEVANMNHTPPLEGKTESKNKIFVRAELEISSNGEIPNNWIILCGWLPRWFFNHWCFKLFGTFYNLYIE